MKIIAVSGFKRSGKDTVADYLKKTRGFERVSFADPLKDLCSSEYGVVRTNFDNPETKEAPILSRPIVPKDAFTRMLAEFMIKEFRGPQGQVAVKALYDNGEFYGVTDKEQFQLYHTPRSLAILKGSTNRLVSPDFWVQKAAQEINNNSHVAGVTQTHSNYVIPDLRYKSEIAELKNTFGSDLITIRINRFDNVVSNDPSELDLVDYKGFDFVVENKGTLDELFGKIDEILETLATR